MKKFLSLSLLISSLFVSSCSKNDEPDVPSQTATIRYEATVDDPENFEIEVHYSKGEYNAEEYPNDYEGIKKTVQSPFVSESFKVKSGAFIWFSATAKTKNENLIIDTQKAVVEVKLYIDDKPTTYKDKRYVNISCLYYPNGIIDFTPKAK